MRIKSNARTTAKWHDVGGPRGSIASLANGGSPPKPLQFKCDSPRRHGHGEKALEPRLAGPYKPIVAGHLRSCCATLGAGEEGMFVPVG